MGSQHHSHRSNVLYDERRNDHRQRARHGCGAQMGRRAHPVVELDGRRQPVESSEREQCKRKGNRSREGGGWRGQVSLRVAGARRGERGMDEGAQNRHRDGRPSPGFQPLGFRILLFGRGGGAETRAGRKRSRAGSRGRWRAGGETGGAGVGTKSQVRGRGYGGDWLCIAGTSDGRGQPNDMITERWRFVWFVIKIPISIVLLLSSNPSPFYNDTNLFPIPSLVLSLLSLYMYKVGR